MTTLKLDTSTGDLAIESGSLVLLSDLGEETAQRLKTKFRFFYGEWFLDTSLGMPYFEKILLKGANLNEVRALFRRTILDDEGVSGINSLTVNLDRASRALTVSFEVTLTDGTPLSFANYALPENLV